MARKRYRESQASIDRRRAVGEREHLRYLVSIGVEVNGPEGCPERRTFRATAGRTFKPASGKPRKPTVDPLRAFADAHGSPYIPVPEWDEWHRRVTGQAPRYADMTRHR